MVSIQEKGKVSFKQATIDFVRGYFDFNGRTTRSGFWWAQLIRLVYIALSWGIIYGCLLTGNAIVFYSAIGILALLLTIPTLALNVRRYRDSGWSNYGIWTYYIAKITFWMISALFLLRGIIVGYIVAQTIAQTLNILSFITMLVATNSMTTVHHHPFIRYFLREKTEPVAELNETGKVTFKQSFFDLFKGYVIFGGTTTRAGYWWMFLVQAIVLSLGVWLARTGSVMMALTLSDTPVVMLIVGRVLCLIGLICFSVPLVAAQTRRLRDAGVSNIGIATLYGISYIIGLCLVLAMRHQALTIVLLVILFVYSVLFIVVICLPSNYLVRHKKSKFLRLMCR